MGFLSARESQFGGKRVGCSGSPLVSDILKTICIQLGVHDALAFVCLCVCLLGSRCGVLILIVWWVLMLVYARSEV